MQALRRQFCRMGAKIEIQGAEGMVGPAPIPKSLNPNSNLEVFEIKVVIFEAFDIKHPLLYQLI